MAQSVVPLRRSHVCASVKKLETEAVTCDTEEIIEILALMRQRDLSPEQIKLKRKFQGLSTDPDLFDELKEPNKSAAIAALTWVLQELAAYDETQSEVEEAC